MKKKICLLLCLSLVLLSACGRKSDNIRFGAADIGGMYYAFASSFSGAVSKDTSDYKFEVKNTAWICGKFKTFIRQIYRPRYRTG